MIIKCGYNGFHMICGSALVEASINYTTDSISLGSMQIISDHVLMKCKMCDNIVCQTDPCCTICGCALVETSTNSLGIHVLMKCSMYDNISLCQTKPYFMCFTCTSSDKIVLECLMTVDDVTKL